VAVPDVSQSFVPPRPLVTWRVIEESQTPGCPGSKKTAIPAMFAAAALPAVTITASEHAIATTRATAARRSGTAKA
jgi:hypothetical protein